MKKRKSTPSRLERILSLPDEISSNRPKITIVGFEQVFIENYKGILEYQDYFVKLGFEIEPFGGDELSIRGIPTDLYGTDAKDLFLTVLDELAESPVRGKPDVILLKIASMSCKAAVKGNQKISYEEAKVLLKRLFSLENPYHCPHGRPTMFSMSKQEIDKKIKRIV